MSIIKTIQFNIKGLHCPHCPAKIEKAIIKMNGVYHIHVDYDNQSGELIFNDEISSLSDIANRIEKMGFTFLDPKES